jgi:hypothetical protein
LNSAAYQRVRLWSGITSIGTNLGAIWIIALTAAAWAQLLPEQIPIVAVMGLIAILWPLANLPFEILVGHATETAFARTTQPLRAWLADWIRTAAVTAISLFFAFTFFYVAASANLALPFLIVAAIIIVIALFRLPGGFPAPPDSPEATYEKELATALTALDQPARPIRWFDNAESTTVNGFTRPLPPRHLCLATNVTRHLTPREAALLAAREEWFARSGAGLLVTAIAALWLLGGVALALLYPAPFPIQSAFLGPAIITTWCFLALFIWPTVNRLLNRRADRHLLTLAPADEITALLNLLQELNATDSALPGAKTSVFHPISPAKERTDALR